MRITTVLAAGLLATSLVVTSSAGAAGTTGQGAWSSTATRAFVPAYLAQTANATGAAIQAYRRALAAASSLATEAAASRPVTVTVALTPRDRAGLDARIAAIAAHGAMPVTPAEYLARYAPAQSDVDGVVAHLEAAGFTGIRVAPNRLLVTADGTAASVKTAFNTGLQEFALGTRHVFANEADAEVPAALAGRVTAVLGLQNVSVPHTHYRLANPASAARFRASGTRAVTGSETGHSPAQFPAIYDAKSVATASRTKVGIITWGTLTKVQSDLKSFASANGYAAPSSTVVKTGSGSYVADSDSDVEWDLDSQTVLGAGGGAVSQIVFYSAPNGGGGTTDAQITQAFNAAVSANVVKVVNVSLGSDEQGAHADGTQAADDQVFQAAVAQGQTFSIAAGDEGAYEHQGGVLTDANGNVDVNLASYSVSEPATSPYVIAVGGTTLFTSGGTTWAAETVWNEGLAYVDSDDDTQRIWATGGGVSAYEAAPSWQKTALGVTGNRRLPDIAFDGASDSGALITYHGSSAQVGGTSLASPIFVGFWARIESGKGNALGFPASGFYKNLPGSGATHDVTSGNNGYGGYGYKAATGYDQTTGYGSFDVAKVSTLIGSSSGF